MNVGLRRFLLWWRLDHDASEVGNDELSCACSSSAFFLVFQDRSRCCVGLAFTRSSRLVLTAATLVLCVVFCAENVQ